MRTRHELAAARLLCYPNAGLPDGYLNSRMLFGKRLGFRGNFGDGPRGQR
jgi:hypothetical protein